MSVLDHRDLAYRSENGVFFCPVCGREVPYERKRVRQFLTFFGLPLVPGAVAAEYIECRECHRTFRDIVLSHDLEAPAEAMTSECQRGVRRIMTQMLLADGRVDEKEVCAVRRIFKQITDGDITEADVYDDIRRIGEEGATIEEYLISLAGSLNTAGKELVLRAAFLVAAADGEFQQEERDLLNRLAKALGMSQRQSGGVLASLLMDQLCDP